MKKLALVFACTFSSALAGCATDATGPAASDGDDRFTQGSSALTLAAPHDLSPDTDVRIRLDTADGTREAVFRPSDVSQKESGAPLAAFMASVPRELRESAVRGLIARHDARAYIELALVTYDGSTPERTADTGGVHAQAWPWAYGAYAACFYGAWAGGADAVEAGDYCRATYLN